VASPLLGIVRNLLQQIAGRVVALLVGQFHRRPQLPGDVEVIGDQVLDHSLGLHKRGAGAIAPAPPWAHTHARRLHFRCYDALTVMRLGLAASAFGTRIVRMPLGRLAWILSGSTWVGNWMVRVNSPKRCSRMW